MPYLGVARSRPQGVYYNPAIRCWVFPCHGSAGSWAPGAAVVWHDRAPQGGHVPTDVVVLRSVAGGWSVFPRDCSGGSWLPGAVSSWRDLAPQGGHVTADVRVLESVAGGVCSP